jgi:hypothetical protein
MSHDLQYRLISDVIPGRYNSAVSLSTVRLSVDDIKSAQQSDERLSKIGEQVKSEAILDKGSSSVKYYEKKGLWFREFQSSKVEKEKVYCQLIVPKQYRRDVMRIAHESIMVLSVIGTNGPTISTDTRLSGISITDILPNGVLISCLLGTVRWHMSHDLI